MSSCLGFWGAAVGSVGLAAAEDRPQASVQAAASPAVKTPKAPPSQEVLKQYGAALAQGREADGKGQLAEARKHFEAAVALVPEGGAAQSELGWAAYRQNDLPAAERATLAAIAASSKPSLRAASLYNLGKIRSAQGKKGEAAEAFRSAWELARNPAALAELKALDPAAAAAAWPTLRALDGPMRLDESTPAARLLAACRAQVWETVDAQTDERVLSRERIYGADAEELHCTEQSATATGLGTASQIRVVSSYVPQNHYTLSTIGVWVKTREGWLHKVISAATSWKWQGETSKLQSVRRIGNLVEIRVVLDSRDESAVAFYWKGGKEKGAPPPESIESSDGFATYLGFGASGRPSLTAPIHFSSSRTVHREEDTQRSAAKTYPLTLQPSGELQIGAPVITRKQMSEKEFTGREVQSPSGSYPLKFP